MKTRFDWTMMIPLLLTISVGCVEQQDNPTDDLRGIAVEPCLPDDCIPVSPLIEDNCPEGTMLIAGAECVNSEEGVCVLEFYEECVPVDEGGEEPPPPPPEPEPEPRPRPCAPDLGIRPS